MHPDCKPYSILEHLRHPLNGPTPFYSSKKNLFRGINSRMPLKTIVPVASKYIYTQLHDNNILVNVSIPSQPKERGWVGGRRHEVPGPASDRCCPAASNSPVCSRVLPVCQPRSVRHPLGITTIAINQATPVAVVKVSYVKRTQPKNINHNAEVSLRQQYCRLFS